MAVLVAATRGAVAVDEDHRLDCCSDCSTAGSALHTRGDCFVADHDHVIFLDSHTNCYYDQNGCFATTKKTTMDARRKDRVVTECHHAYSD